MSIYLRRVVMGNLYQLRFYLKVNQVIHVAGKCTAIPALIQASRHRKV